MRLTAALFIAIVVLACDVSARAAAPTTRPVAAVERALIISVDGLRPDLILRAKAPRMQWMIESGAFTLWARTTPSAITLPSHVSMLTGETPDVHAIKWNDEQPAERRVYPAVPTLFELAKKCGYTTAIVAGKSKFTTLLKPATIDWQFVSVAGSEDPETTSRAIEILRSHRPHVMFLHLASVDTVGHAKGWGSPEQLAAIELADRCIDKIFGQLDELDIQRATMVIVTSDHGGEGRTHGPDDARSRTIPWLVVGPGIRKGFDLTRIGDLNVETYDTFATTCVMLGIPIDRPITGKFVDSILQK